MDADADPDDGVEDDDRKKGDDVFAEKISRLQEESELFVAEEVVEVAFVVSVDDDDVAALRLLICAIISNVSLQKREPKEYVESQQNWFC